MTTILDFAKNYRSDEEQYISEMLFVGIQVIQNKKNEQFRATYKKNIVNLHFHSHFIF